MQARRHVDTTISSAPRCHCGCGLRGPGPRWRTVDRGAIGEACADQAAKAAPDDGVADAVGESEVSSAVMISWFGLIAGDQAVAGGRMVPNGWNRVKLVSGSGCASMRTARKPQAVAVADVATMVSCGRICPPRRLPPGSVQTAWQWMKGLPPDPAESCIGLLDPHRAGRCMRGTEIGDVRIVVRRAGA